MRQALRNIVKSMLPVALAVSTVALSVPFILSTLAGASDPFRDIESPSLVPLPAIETEIKLPVKDATGQPIPQGELIFLIMPACNSCSAASTEWRIDFHKSNQNIVVAFPSEVRELPSWTRRPRKGVWIIADSRSEYIPAGAQIRAPIGIELDNGKVRKYRTESELQLLQRK